MPENDPLATCHIQTKPQPELTTVLVTDENSTVDMRHRVFGLRRPVDMLALDDAIRKFKARAPTIVYTDALPKSLTTLNVVVSTALASSWIENGYDDPLEPGKNIVLISFVENSLRKIVQNSSMDPRDIITSMA